MLIVQVVLQVDQVATNILCNVHFQMCTHYFEYLYVDG